MRFAGRVSAANYIAAGRNAAEQSASFAKTAADNAPDFQSLSEESIRQEAKNYDDAVKNAASIINSGTVAQRDIDLSKAKVEIYEAEKEGERGVRKAGLLVKGAGALGSALIKEPERKLRQTDTSLLQSEYNRLTNTKDSHLADYDKIMGEKYTPSTPTPSSSETTSTNSSPLQTDEKGTLDTIFKYESKGSGGYDAYNLGGSDGGHTPHGSGDSKDNRFGKALSSMTLGEIDKLGQAGSIHATGRYQFTHNTGSFREAMDFAGLKPTDTFSAANQDKMALAFGKKYGSSRWIGLKNASGAEMDQIRRVFGR